MRRKLRRLAKAAVVAEQNLQAAKNPVTAMIYLDKLTRIQAQINKITALKLYKMGARP